MSYDALSINTVIQELVLSYIWTAPRTTLTTRPIQFNNMSNRLRQCEFYIKLLLTSDQVQAEGLLVTASDKQVECLSEIIRNILRLPVSRKTRDLIQLHNKTLTTLSDKKIAVDKRLALLQKSHLYVLQVLISVKKKLMPLL